MDALRASIGLPAGIEAQVIMDRPDAQSFCGQSVDELEAFEVIGGEGALTASTLRWAHYSGAFPGSDSLRVYVKQFGNNTDRVKRAAVRQQHR